MASSSFGNPNVHCRKRRETILITPAFCILWVAIVCLLSGCKTKERIVRIETVRTDTAYITRWQRDSIYLQDSTHTRESRRGDTVFVEVERLRRISIEKAVHDTLREATHDSIPKPYPVEVEVPARLTWWQQTRLHLANILLYVCGIFVCIKLVQNGIKRRL